MRTGDLIALGFVEIKDVGGHGGHYKELLDGRTSGLPGWSFLKKDLFMPPWITNEKIRPSKGSAAPLSDKQTRPIPSPPGPWPA